MKEVILLMVSSAIVNNVILSQFLGLCPFFGVSKKVNTAASMGAAVIFVITIASCVTAVINQFVLVKLNITYLQTIVFILIIAVCRDVSEEIISLPVQCAGRLSSPDYDKLCRIRCGSDECPEKLQHRRQHIKRFRDCSRFHHRNCDYGRYS